MVEHDIVRTAVETLSAESLLIFSRYETASQILSSRDTLFGMLGGNTRLQELLHHGARTNRLMEVEVNLNSSSVYRKHGALQDALSTVTYLSELIEPCRSMGLGIDGAINVETTDVLWELGEIIPSIKMLQHIESTIDWSSQSVAVGRAGIFAALVSFKGPLSSTFVDHLRDIEYRKPVLKNLRKFKTSTLSVL